MKQIKVIGIGMGDEASMTVAARDWLRECELLIGGSRMVRAAADIAASDERKTAACGVGAESVGDAENEEKTVSGIVDGRGNGYFPGEKNYVIAWKPKDVWNAVRRSQAEKIAVLMSGDIGFFSGAKALREEIARSDQREPVDSVFQGTIKGMRTGSAIDIGSAIDAGSAADAGNVIGVGNVIDAGNAVDIESAIDIEKNAMDGNSTDVCEYEISWLPGISSLSYFCDAIGIPYEDAFMLSIHGRSSTCIRQIAVHEKTFLLSDGNLPEFGKKLVSFGLKDVVVWVGMDLAAPTQYIRKMTPEELAQFPEEECRPLTVCLILNPEAEKWRNPYLRDGEFCRDGKTPMTKEEVRGIILGKLHPERKDVIWDIGGGSGSVSVTCAIAASGGTVYSIECDPDAAKLIGENRRRFACDNIEIIAGRAPEALRGLPTPDRVFIGGSGGKLAEILAELEAKPGFQKETFEESEGNGGESAEMLEGTEESTSRQKKSPEKSEENRRDAKDSVRTEQKKKGSDETGEAGKQMVAIGEDGGYPAEKSVSENIGVQETQRKMRVVISSITLETSAAVSSYINTSPYVKNPEVCQIAVTKGKKIGGSTLMMAQNPVTIVSFDLVVPA